MKCKAERFVIEMAAAGLSLNRRGVVWDNYLDHITSEDSAERSLRFDDGSVARKAEGSNFDFEVVEFGLGGVV